MGADNIGVRLDHGSVDMHCGMSFRGSSPLLIQAEPESTSRSGGEVSDPGCEFNLRRKANGTPLLLKLAYR